MRDSKDKKELIRKRFNYVSIFADDLIQVNFCRKLLLNNGFTKEDIKKIRPDKAFILFFKLLEMGINIG